MFGMYLLHFSAAVVTKLETDHRSGESFAHTVAMLGKGNSFGVRINLGVFT